MGEIKEKIEKADEEKLAIFNEWKKAYFDELVKALNPSDDVLQIGFDENAANEIQKFKPKSHTIVVASSDAKKASAWANSHANCKIIEGEWKNALSKLGTFKTVLYSDYQDVDAMKTMNYLFSEEIMTEVAKTKELLKAMGEEMSHVPMRYSDNDLEEFYKKIGQYNQEKLLTFFRNLANNNNITENQYEVIIKKYKLDAEKNKQASDSSVPQEAMLDCLEDCLKNHMKIGSRFCSFASNATSKYDDSQFFEKIITDPHVDYKETIVSLKLPKKNQDALVVIIEKK